MTIRVQCRDFMERSDNINWVHTTLAALFSLILFGFAGFSGRPLTMHEARLPETSREMLAHHEWLLPTSGGRPWLERPPLPHWLVIGAMKLFGQDDRVWVVRLPSAIMGATTVIMTMFIATRYFGLAVGVTAGCMLATSVKFYQYACLAEDDIYLAALISMAAGLFVWGETSQPLQRRLHWYDYFTNRSWAVWGFFIVLGLSNVAKGPLLGILILGMPVAAYAAWQGVQTFLRYTWLIGWVLLVALLIAWPLWAYHNYPDVLENWKYDYLGRMSGDYSAINEPWWYYPPKLAVGLLPWAPLCLMGLWMAWKGRAEAGNKFILCWAVVPLLVLSIPKGKHDHYLVPFLAPWAILGAVALVELTKSIRTRGIILVVSMILIGVFFSFIESAFAAKTDHTVDDTAFLIRCRNEVPRENALYIDAKLGPPGNLDFFRIQFYSRAEAILLHNLSFLRDKNITWPIVYVIARQHDEPLLRQLGSIDLIDQSPNSHEMGKDHGTFYGRFTLYRLTFKPDLQRYPRPQKITSLQAMERAQGPWCGPPMQ